jgi:hypothetical protein
LRSTTRSRAGFLRRESRRVLIAPDGPLDYTTNALRPITARHLLTMTCGWGLVLEETPLQKTTIELSLEACVCRGEPLGYWWSIVAV